MSAPHSTRRWPVEACRAVVVVATCGLLLVSPDAFAADGDPDPSFGVNGRVLHDFGSGEGASAGVVQPDQRIVAAGTTGIDGLRKFALARYLPDGSFDTSFGNGGKQLIDFSTWFGPGDAQAHALALQNDGRLIVAGSVKWLPGTSGAVARQMPNGAADAGFGTGGRVLTSIPGYDRSRFRALALESGGRIVAGGQGHPGAGGSDAVLVRYLPDGSLDSTFGAGGFVTIDLAGAYEEIAAVVMQPDGKLVAAGSVSHDAKLEFLLLRVTASGQLDPTFGTGGAVRTEIVSQSINQAAALVVQPDGRIVAVGTAWNAASQADFALARYLVNGALDPSFGTGGVVTTDFADNNDFARAVSLETDGRILVGGSALVSGSGHKFAAARYHPDGTLDPAFGTGGRRTLELGGDADDAFGMAVQADRRIVLVGASDASDSQGDFALMRLHNQGQTLYLTHEYTMDYVAIDPVALHVHGPRPIGWIFDTAYAGAIGDGAKCTVQLAWASPSPSGSVALMAVGRDGSNARLLGRTALRPGDQRPVLFPVRETRLAGEHLWFELRLDGNDAGRLQLGPETFIQIDGLALEKSLPNAR